MTAPPRPAAHTLRPAPGPGRAGRRRTRTLGDVRVRAHLPRPPRTRRRPARTGPATGAAPSPRDG